MLVRPRPPTIPTARKYLEKRCPLEPITTATAFRRAGKFADTLATLAHPNQAQRQYYTELTKLLHQYRLFELNKQRM